MIISVRGRGNNAVVTPTVHISESEAETLSLGARLARRLRAGMVVALAGDLGAGKTVFSRGIARELGIDEPVTSPTYNVVQEYQCPSGIWLFHLDMYRIHGEEDALAFGVEEYLFSPDGIAVIEWPGRIAGLLEPDFGGGAMPPEALVKVTIRHRDEGCRVIEISPDLSIES